MLTKPAGIYINWAAYDELSDDVQLTEALAMRELDELLRLRRGGVQIDYYLMDAFWYERASGYRQWRKSTWPKGPDRWLDKCLSNGVKPALWVATNNCGRFAGLAPHPAWKDSLTSGEWACCMFAGGFLQHFMESLDLWYQRGVRLYKFDFCALEAATPAIARTMLPSEIRRANCLALTAALKSFRQSHPEVVLIAYNGFAERGELMGNTSRESLKMIDTAWLEAFDSVYCGDPRPADVPAMNFWRSKDVYSDHMVRVFEENGYPLSRIDNSGFMIGKTGTCYRRGNEAWKGMLLLSLARGGWANTYYGNLELLSDVDAKWFARAQKMLLPLQQFGQISTFGARPGSGQIYGFVAKGESGSLLTVVNPSQTTGAIKLPVSGRGKVLFRDAGFEVGVEHGTVKLGGEQMALIGFGEYAQGRYDLGVQKDVSIAAASENLRLKIESQEARSIRARVASPGGTLRIILRQFEAGGIARRTTGGAPPRGKSLGELLHIEASQGGGPLPLRINCDKAIWSGLSWFVAESDDLDRGEVEIRCWSDDAMTAQLALEAYNIRYTKEPA